MTVLEIKAKEIIPGPSSRLCSFLLIMYIVLLRYQRFFSEQYILSFVPFVYSQIGLPGSSVHRFFDGRCVKICC